MTEFLRRQYRKLEQIIVPGLRYSTYEYCDQVTAAAGQDIVWLDIGCGHQAFAPWMRSEQQKAYSKCRGVYGIDLDFEGLKKHTDLKNKVLASGNTIPFRDGSFGLITANMVMEHVAHPFEFLQEVHRILRPGGVFIAHTPNRWGYRVLAARLLANQRLKNKLVKVMEGREEHDVFPTFYRFNQVDEVKEIARKAGFEVDGIKTVESNANFQILLPLAAVELLFIRLLQSGAARNFRSVLLVSLRRPVETNATLARANSTC
jgi:2-polyprenyl-3-methyl-5-hydroxy-6-metoxy-1,4-benzoquinol methylase